MIKSVIEQIERFEQSLSDFVDIRERMAHFSERGDLDRVYGLGIDERLPVGDQVLRGLSPYFQAGAWLESGQLKGIIVRGEYFPITDFQWPVTLALPDSHSPVEIKEGPTAVVWRRLNLRTLAPDKDARTFLFHPTQETCFIFATAKPVLWLSPHLEAAMRLINRAYEII